MNTAQSHWQSDDGEAVPVRVHGAQAETAAVPLSSVSRRPAAIVGIIAVLAMGVAAMNMGGGFTAQVGGETVIRITASGFTPKSVTVAPGATVRWRNDDAIPHILASGTLNTEETSPLESLPIFPGEEYAAVITADAQPGTYDYISRTSDFNGTVIVQGDEADQAPPDAMPEPPVTNRPPANTPPPVRPPSTTAPRSAAHVPVNPYTVDKAGIRRQAMTGAAMGGPAQPQTPPPAMTQTKTKPAMQPASGPASGALILAVVMGVWVLWRKTLHA